MSVLTEILTSVYKMTEVPSHTGLYKTGSVVSTSSNCTSIFTALGNNL